MSGYQAGSRPRGPPHDVIAIPFWAHATRLVVSGQLCESRSRKSGRVPFGHVDTFVPSSTDATT